MDTASAFDAVMPTTQATPPAPTPLPMKAPEGISLRAHMTQASLARTIGIQSAAVGKQLRELALPRYEYGRTVLLPSSTVRRVLESRGFEYPSLIVAVQTLKGGAGKTSTAFNMAIRAYQYGFRVLVVDLDPQANISQAFNVRGEQVLAHHLDRKNPAPFEELIREVEPGLDVIPSSFDNANIDLEMFTQRLSSEQLLHEPLEKLRSRYDLIILDCNPSLSALNRAAACAADTVLIPVNGDSFALDGLAKTLDEVEQTQALRKNDLPQARIVYTMFDKRENTSRAFLVKYSQEYGDMLMKTVISRWADVRTGTTTNRSVFEIASARDAQEDFDALTCELLGLSAKFAERTDA